MREKYVHKSESDINRMVGGVKSGFSDNWMWASIIERMYDHKDCLDLEEHFHEAI